MNIPHPTSPDKERSQPDTTNGPWFKIAAAIVLGAGIIAVIAGPTEQWLRQLFEWIEALGFVGGLIFVVVYVMATILFVPGLILTVGAGFLFGLLWGTVVVSIASTIGALAAFILGRHIARDSIRHRVRNLPRFDAVYRAIGKEDFKIVFLTRLVPIFPFNLLNYAYGLTDVDWKRYTLASWIGMLPGTVAHVYVGAAAQNLTRALSADSPPSSATYLLWGLGLAASFGVVWLITQTARRELNAALDESSPVDEVNQSPD